MSTMCLLVSPDGSTKTIHTAHKHLSELLGGPLTFVGVMPECDAFLLALRTQNEELKRHVWNDTHCTLFPDGDIVCGSIVIVASNDEGEEVDLDVERVVQCLAQ